MDLYTELQEKQDELNMAIKELRLAGQKSAKADTDYRVKVAQATLRLKAQGCAVGLIDKVIYDDDDVAEALFERNLSEVMYKASQEEVNALKLKIKTIDSQLTREYGR